MAWVIISLLCLLAASAPVPAIFDLAYNVVKPFLNEVTRKKIHPIPGAPGGFLSIEAMLYFMLVLFADTVGTWDGMVSEAFII